MGEHYRAAIAMGKLVSGFRQVKRSVAEVWLPEGRRGDGEKEKKNQISQCTLVSRRRAQGTPLE